MLCGSFFPKSIWLDTSSKEKKVRSQQPKVLPSDVRTPMGRGCSHLWLGVVSGCRLPSGRALGSVAGAWLSAAVRFLQRDLRVSGFLPEPIGSGGVAAVCRESSWILVHQTPPPFPDQNSLAGATCCSRRHLLRPGRSGCGSWTGAPGAQDSAGWGAAEGGSVRLGGGCVGQVQCAGGSGTGGGGHWEVMPGCLCGRL